MKDRDELDRLLRELGNATPDAGFGQRVLRGIERRQLSPVPHRAPRKLLPFGLAYALAVAVVCAGLSVIHRRHDALPTGRPAAIAALRTPAQPAPEVRLAAKLRTRVSATQQRAQLLEPGALVSFPAPPAPLTEQEMLLLRVVRGHHAVEEAMLQTDALPLDEARARAEFLRFFPPADPPANEVLPAETRDPGVSQASATPTGSTAKDNKGDPK